MAHQQLWFVFLLINRRVGEVNSMKIGVEGLHPSSFPLKKALIEFRIYLGRRGERDMSMLCLQGVVVQPVSVARIPHSFNVVSDILAARGLRRYCLLADGCGSCMGELCSRSSHGTQQQPFFLPASLLELLRPESHSKLGARILLVAIHACVAS